MAINSKLFAVAAVAVFVLGGCERETDVAEPTAPETEVAPPATTTAPEAPPAVTTTPESAPPAAPATGQ
jgi:hypothetical protein